MSESGSESGSVTAEERYVPGVRMDRLERLLEHMEKGRLSVDRFNFGVFHADTACGTIGCMGGELPAVFPEWEHPPGAFAPRLKGETGDLFRDFGADARWFFGLEFAEVLRLFYPRDKHGRFEFPFCLAKTATREEVTANLRRLIEEKKEALKRVRGEWDRMEGRKQW